MLNLCEWGQRHSYRHFFYGGAEGVADELANRLASRYPGLIVAGTCCPPFRPMSEAEDRRAVEQINASRPDVVWVGLGAPKQEKWMFEHVGRIHAPVIIGVGAAFDFHSGRIAWAPGWIRRIGMEWIYRLAREPGRMWRRNLDSPRFLFRVLCQKGAMLANRRIRQTSRRRVYLPAGRPDSAVSDPPHVRIITPARPAS
jgi:N-acetylglucosaminyldiphosphoundecaprenol N-acetyl-beta-D-mannosaminyltransferase